MGLSLTGSGPRVRIEQGQGATTVLIASQTGILSLVAMVAILGFWTFGGLFAVALLSVALDNGESGAFFGIWLTVWVVAEVIGVIVIAWRLFGRIVISATASGLTIGHKVLGLGPVYRVPADSFSGMSWILDDRMTNVRINGKRIPQPSLRIHALPRTFSVARGIMRDDADAVVAAVKMRLGKARFAA